MNVEYGRVKQQNEEEEKKQRDGSSVSLKMRDRIKIK
jgi:hypothetical protein